MTELRPEDTFHKSYLNRLLMEIIDRPTLVQALAFKGGTCAAMLGYLDRFSVDLDFDLLVAAAESAVRSEFKQIFNHQGVEIIKDLQPGIFFQVRYPSPVGRRNSLKVGVSTRRVQANQYQVQPLPEIDRLMTCQTLETMVANKLVALSDRYRLHKTIAGRDLYDIHHFLVQGYRYAGDVIVERTGMAAPDYLKSLIVFIQEHITQTLIDEDLNTLLPYAKFQQMRKILIPETLALLTREQQQPVLAI